MSRALAVLGKNGYRIVRVLGNEEGEQCVDYVHRLVKFESDHSAYGIAVLNFGSHELALAAHLHRMQQRGGWDPSELPMIAVESQRQVCNFLASFSAFLYHSERLIRD